MTYGNYSGVVSSGEESSIITVIENMHVEQRECHKEDSRKHDTFKVAQKERFILVDEHLIAQENNFNSFASYTTKKFNEICQNMALNHGATQTSINNKIHYQNHNHHHYKQFYREMRDFLDYEYRGEGVAWYRGRRPKVRNHIGHGRGH